MHSSSGKGMPACHQGQTGQGRLWGSGLKCSLYNAISSVMHKVRAVSEGILRFRTDPVVGEVEVV